MIPTGRRSVSIPPSDRRPGFRLNTPVRKGCASSAAAEHREGILEHERLVRVGTCNDQTFKGGEYTWHGDSS